MAHVAKSIDSVSKRVQVIVQTLPRKTHARKELKKVALELEETLLEIIGLQKNLKKRQKRNQKQGEWKAAKREAERNKASSRPRHSNGGSPEYLDDE